MKTKVAFLTSLLLIFAAPHVRAATYTVTTLADSGPGSLRAAIEQAIATPADDTIDFAVSGTIVLASTLETGVGNGKLTIDGANRAIVISGNGAVRVLRAGVEEAGVEAALEVKNLTIANGNAGGSGGGGIRQVGGPLTITNCVFTGNTAYEGGGVFSDSGTTTISDSLFTANSAADVGGAVMGVESTITITGSRFTGNTANRGGGIHTFHTNSVVQITNSVLSDNQAVQGGAISAQALVTVADSTLSGNVATDAGGGIFGSVEYGDSRVSVNRSTLTGNVATNAGGGIYLLFTNGFTIDNSTFVNNTTTGAGGRGGGFLANGAPNAVTNSTFVGSAIDGFDLAYVEYRTHLSNSLVVNSACSNLIDGGYNIDTGAGCGFSGTSQSNFAGPLLSPLGLGDNGGLTQTIALDADSAAIDAIPPGTNGCGAVDQTDQRGVTRPQSAGCDIGAFEREALAFTFTGFFAPVNNLPTINLVKAGSAVPVKFSLGGDHGLDVLAGAPTAPAIACTPGNPTDSLTEVVAAGNSGLQFDPVTLTYTYVWKTDKAFANTCRELQIALTDGSVHKARFQFSK